MKQGQAFDENTDVAQRGAVLLSLRITIFRHRIHS